METALSYAFIFSTFYMVCLFCIVNYVVLVGTCHVYQPVGCTFLLARTVSPSISSSGRLGKELFYTITRSFLLSIIGQSAMLPGCLT